MKEHYYTDLIHVFSLHEGFVNHRRNFNGVHVIAFGLLMRKGAGIRGSGYSHLPWAHGYTKEGENPMKLENWSKEGDIGAYSGESGDELPVCTENCISPIYGLWHKCKGLCPTKSLTHHFLIIIIVFVVVWFKSRNGYFSQDRK